MRRWYADTTNESVQSKEKARGSKLYHYQDDS